jgi:hypothetical protein
MSIPKHPIPDERWCDLMASNAVEELVAGKLLDVGQFEFAKRIIAQQAYVLLISNAYPAGDLNSN